MKAKQLILNDQAVYLRLSAVKLAEYAERIGSSGNTLFAILDSLDDMKTQAALFEAALNYKGNPNEIHSGYDLIDMLAEAEYGPVEVKMLIVTLAVESGVISKVDAARLTAAVKSGNDRLYDAAVAILSGDMSGIPATTGQLENTAEENPI